VATNIYFSKDWQPIEEDWTSQGLAQQNQNVWGLAYVDDLILQDQSRATPPATQPSGGGVTPDFIIGGTLSRLYAQQDANWNTTALVDTTGTVQERYVYDPYGNVTVLNADGSVRGNGSQSASNYSWVYLRQGGRLDSITSIYNFRHRDYSASLGRWLEEGFPLQYEDGLNPYEAFISDPITITDPQGYAAVPAFPFIAGRGTFTATLKYHDDWSSDFNLAWNSNHAGQCNCNEIMFMQFERDGGKGNFNLDNKDSNGNVGFGGIWYLYPGQAPGSTTASLGDLPGASSEIDYDLLQPFTQEFLTVAICFGGTDAGKSYGTIYWMHSYRGDGVNREIVDKQHSQAVSRFNNQSRVYYPQYTPTN
jgi:RHS repeat-associated protein